MAFLTQSRFPKLWLFFQRMVGGTKDKQRLVTLHYGGQKRILEIGCSVGIVSEAFSRYPDARFTGIDIDDNALAFARKRLGSLPNFRFVNVALSDLAKSGETFDYVVFANILHHVDDRTAVALLKDVQSLLAAGSTLIVMEPEKRREGYGLVFRFFYTLEKGEYRRSREELTGLIAAAGLSVRHCSEELLSPDSMRFLKVGRSILIEVGRA